MKYNRIYSFYRLIQAGVIQAAGRSTSTIPLQCLCGGLSANTETAFFADDTAILAKSINNNKLVEYMQRANFAIIFHPHQLIKPDKKINLNVENIQWQRRVKYLGFTIIIKLT